MLPISLDKGILLLELEAAWRRAMRRTRRAAHVYSAAAIFFVIGFVKFAYLVPAADCPSYEVVIWLSSAALLLPSLLWFGHSTWKEFKAYREMAAFTGHPSASRDIAWVERLALIVEFCRAGRG